MSRGTGLRNGVALALARRRGDVLLVLRRPRQGRRALVVVAPGHRVLELAHALAERATDLGHAGSAEQKQHHDEEDEDLGKPDTKGHEATLATVSGAPGAPNLHCYDGPRGGRGARHICARERFGTTGAEEP